MDKKDIKKRLREKLISSGIFFKEDKNKKEMVDYLRNTINNLNLNYLNEEEKEKIILQVVDDLIGWGPLQPLMEDDDITEIMINGPYTVYIEKEGKMRLTDIKFDDEGHLKYIIEKMITPTGRRVDESYPYVDFSLEDGTRINVVLPPVSACGIIVTIRKFTEKIKTLEDLIELGTLDEKIANFLKACIKAKVNMIFSGATGVGKTTLVKVLSSYIDSEERIITIEDALELHLKQKHVIRLLTRPPSIEGKGEITIHDLFLNVLRMRPSRIILGEIRGEEALDFLQALLSGHQGGLAVIHASSPEEVITRLETMALYAKVNLPNWIIRQQIAQGLDLIVQLAQLVDGSRKIVRITEVKGEENEIFFQDLFYFDQEKVEKEKVIGKFKATGKLPCFVEKFKKRNIEIDEEWFKK